MRWLWLDNCLIIPRLVVANYCYDTLQTHSDQPMKGNCRFWHDMDIITSNYNHLHRKEVPLALTSMWDFKPYKHNYQGISTSVYIYSIVPSLLLKPETSSHWNMSSNLAENIKILHSKLWWYLLWSYQEMWKLPERRLEGQMVHCRVRILSCNCTHIYMIHIHDTYTYLHNLH